MIRLLMPPASLHFWIVFTLTGLVAAPARCADLEWARYWSYSSIDHGNSIAVNRAGDVFVAGQTSSKFFDPNPLSYDVVTRRYDRQGEFKWQQFFGVFGDDINTSAAADEMGNFYFVGTTEGNLGGMRTGTDDAFFMKTDRSGQLQWARQFSFDIHSHPPSIALDLQGNSYIAGSSYGFNSYHLYLRKYDAAGELVWSKVMESPAAERTAAVAADGIGALYVVGSINTPFVSNSYDVILRKYDIDGDLVWSRRFGSSQNDQATSVAADALGHVFITGNTLGDLDGDNAGSFDGFVTMFDAAGNQTWARQLGGPSLDSVTGVAVDHFGNASIVGSRLITPLNSRWLHDGFVASYDFLGNQRWRHEIESHSESSVFAVASDGRGSTYVTGRTLWQLSPYDPDSGNGNVFLLKYLDRTVPEPGTGVLASLFASLLLAHLVRPARPRIVP